MWCCKRMIRLKFQRRTGEVSSSTTGHHSCVQRWFYCVATLVFAQQVFAQSEVGEFSQQSRDQELSNLNSPQRGVRMRAMGFFEQWAKRERVAAKKFFLHAYENHAEPEVRERFRLLLKSMAADDYATVGEGYVGISMGQEWQGFVPGDSVKRFGMVVTGIAENSPAAMAKLQVGDVIVALDKEIWREAQVILDDKQGLSARIRALGAGSKASFGIWRDSELLTTEVILTRRPVLLDQWRPQLQPNGMKQLDQEELQKLMEEEKNSAAYFQEWLEQARKELRAK